MMSVRFSDEVLKLHNIYQKFDIPETSTWVCVKGQRLDLLDFLPDIKGFFEPFLAIELQICYRSCRLVYNKSLILAGLVGGGPTFVGTVLGSLWTSTITSVFFLSIAGGALIYASMLMYYSGRKQTTNVVMILGIFVGLCAGFVTDLIVTLGEARYV